jgi:hypothetical protein
MRNRFGACTALPAADAPGSRVGAAVVCCYLIKSILTWYLQFADVFFGLSIMPIYLNYEGIVGPVARPPHAGWIELRSVQPCETDSNGVRRLGSAGRQPSTIIMTKRKDHVTRCQ